MPQITRRPGTRILALQVPSPKVLGAQLLMRQDCCPKVVLSLLRSAFGIGPLPLLTEGKFLSESNLGPR